MIITEKTKYSDSLLLPGVQLPDKKMNVYHLSYW